MPASPEAVAALEPEAAGFSNSAVMADPVLGR